MRNPAALADGDAAQYRGSRWPTRWRTGSRITPTFLNELPRLYASSNALHARFDLRVEEPALRLPPFLTVGTWIGGDRDGNPFVDGRRARGALAQQARSSSRYLEETDHLYKELVIVGAHPRRSGRDRGAGRRVRRSPLTAATSLTGGAMAGIYARLAAAAEALAGVKAPSGTPWAGPPTPKLAEFLADLSLVIDARSTRNGAGRARRGQASLRSSAR